MSRVGNDWAALPQTHRKCASMGGFLIEESKLLHKLLNVLQGLRFGRPWKLIVS